VSSASEAASVFQEHRSELGFVNRAQCEEKDLYTVERSGQTVGAALGNHCVRKPQTTLYELAVLPEYRREGIATELIRRMARDSPHEKIVAKCPVDLSANEFYEDTGWQHIGKEDGKNRDLNIWEYDIPPVDIITTGRPDLTEYAAEYGYLRGTRLDDEPRYRREDVRVDFLDVHWEDPDFESLLDAAEWHQPAYVVAGDYDADDENYDLVNERARELRQYAQNVIIVPHAEGELEKVPEWAVVGYSVPTDYAATEIPLRQYRETSHDIHILGGTPHEQHRLLGQLWLENVVSMDCNSHHKAATIGAKAWYPAKPRWRKVGPEGMENAVEQAYRISVTNLHQDHLKRGLK